jgi:hypothetical protein
MIQMYQELDRDKISHMLKFKIVFKEWREWENWTQLMVKVQHQDIVTSLYLLVLMMELFLSIC